MTKIGNLEILSLEIRMHNIKNADETYDFGALTLTKDGRECILDCIQTTWEEDKNDTIITCDLAEDKDTFAECKYDLADIDIMSDELKSEFYIGGSFSNFIESITLFVKMGNCTKAIDVEQE